MTLRTEPGYYHKPINIIKRKKTTLKKKKLFTLCIVDLPMPPTYTVINK